MRGAPPFVDFLFNLCPICVIAMPIITIAVLIKMMARKKDEPTQVIDPEKLD